MPKMRQSKESHQLEMILRRARYRKHQQKHIEVLAKRQRLNVSGGHYATFISSKDYTMLCNDERAEGLR